MAHGRRNADASAMGLRNCWYVIAWEHEVPAAGSPGLFARTVLKG